MSSELFLLNTLPTNFEIALHQGDLNDTKNPAGQPQRKEVNRPSK